MDKKEKLNQEQSDDSWELIGNEYNIEKLTKINHELILKNLKLTEKNAKLSKLVSSLRKRLAEQYKIVLKSIAQPDQFI